MVISAAAGLALKAGIAKGITAGATIRKAVPVIGGIMGLFGNKNNSAKAAAQQYQYNLALQQQQQQWNEYMYKNRYQMQREDMEKAGINPLFGMGQAPSVTSGLNSTSLPDYVGEQNNKFQQALSLLDFTSNLSAKAAQTKLIQNQADTEKISANLKTLETQTQALENLRRKKDLTYQDKKAIAELKESMSRTMLNIEQTQTEQVQRGYIRANTGKAYAETRNQILNNKPLERHEKYMQNHPFMGGTLEGAKNNAGAITTLLGMLAGGAIGGKAAVGRLNRRSTRSRR